MSQHEMMPLSELINQWDEEMPLMAMDTILRQMLGYVQEGEAERAKLMKRVDGLTVDVAALRSRLKQLPEGGDFDVNL